MPPSPVARHAVITVGGYIEKQIVDPNSQIAQGFPPDVMPQDYGTQLSPEDLKGLVDCLFNSTGGKGGS